MSLSVTTNSFILDRPDDTIKRLNKLVANYSTNPSNINDKSILVTSPSNVDKLRFVPKS